jgi:hypothetical protein
MKTAVSIPDPLFKTAARLDAVYGDQDSEIDDDLVAAQRRATARDR